MSRPRTVVVPHWERIKELERLSSYIQKTLFLGPTNFLCRQEQAYSPSPQLVESSSTGPLSVGHKTPSSQLDRREAGSQEGLFQGLTLLDQWLAVSLKGQTVNTLGFVSQAVPVATTQLCLIQWKQPFDDV